MKYIIYEGNLIIRNSEDAKKYKNIIKVTGDLPLNSSGHLDAPKLEVIT